MTVFPDTLFIVVIALAIDALIGEPVSLWSRLGHPVQWMGWLIAQLDALLNREINAPDQRRMAGVSALVAVIFISGAAAIFVDDALDALPHPLNILAKGAIASVFIAQKSLYQHVARVGAAFRAGGLDAARAAVSQIVGRDPAQLDESGVSRAAIESCAENFSDGVVAPAFWLALLGLPGLVIYKAVNTLDSMIGHRTPRHEMFGWASARLDDLLNFIPARFSGALVALSGLRPRRAFRVMIRDASLHRSPNAGWPESAMAASLGVALAGPRAYAGRVVLDPFLHAEGSAARAGDVDRALRVFALACALHILLYLLIALAL